MQLRMPALSLPARLLWANERLEREGRVQTESKGIVPEMPLLLRMILEMEPEGSQEMPENLQGGFVGIQDSKPVVELVMPREDLRSRRMLSSGSEASPPLRSESSRMGRNRGILGRGRGILGREGGSSHFELGARGERL